MLATTLERHDTERDFERLAAQPKRVLVDMSTITILSGLLVVLAGLAAGAGLFVEGLYRDPAVLVPTIRGQDLVTLLVLPVLAAATWRTRQGSRRAPLIWLGVAGYLLYTYTGAAFAYRFNSLFLVYVALFSLTGSALLTAVRCSAFRTLGSRFAPPFGRGSTVAALLVLALMVGVPELVQIGSALASGTVPDLIIRSKGAGNFVYVLDLGVVLPLVLVATRGVARQRPWAYVLAGCMFVKGLTMGLALLSATWFQVRAGLPVEKAFTVVYAVIAAGSGAMTFRIANRRAAV